MANSILGSELENSLSIPKSKLGPANKSVFLDTSSINVSGNYTEPKVKYTGTVEFGKSSVVSPEAAALDRQTDVMEEQGDRTNKYRYAQAASAGVASIGSWMQAYDNHKRALVNSYLIDEAIKEKRRRLSVNMDAVSKQGDQMAAAQTAAFVKSGVEVSGTAADTIANTFEQVFDAKAEMVAQHSYDVMSLFARKGDIESSISEGYTGAMFSTFSAGLSIYGAGA